MPNDQALELECIRRKFGDVLAVDNVSIAVAKGEFVTLLGPSGSGKTSTLRLIGGFEDLDSGSIRINGQRVDHLPAYQRDTATIFQSGALFPHKTVAENIAYGLRMRNVAKADMPARIKHGLDVVRLSGYEDRYPSQLSGGQKQRVALARSLVVQPAVLLFDEPLSALDLSLRLQLRSEIKRLHDELGFSAIYVTHDQGEAMAMSSRIAVMNKGRIEQIDAPDQIFHAPVNEFVYTFIGESCCLPVTFANGKAMDQAGAAVDLNLLQRQPDGPCRVYVRPARLRLAEQAVSAENKLSAHVRLVEFLGDFYRYHLEAGALELFADYTGDRRYPIGAAIEVGWETADMRTYR
jgi:ABC-type Fe3+/spermidine/putrescine transport system ATPase subunit